MIVEAGSMERFLLFFFLGSNWQMFVDVADFFDACDYGGLTENVSTESSTSTRKFIQILYFVSPTTPFYSTPTGGNVN